MSVDYSKLYGHDYFGHQPGSTSFQKRFPDMLSGLIRELGCTTTLDVGSGNGSLVQSLAEIGIDGIALDLRGHEPSKVYPFNLVLNDTNQRSVVRELLKPLTTGKHFTSCLDVLEHIARPDLAAAIWNLRELSSTNLLVSASTRPSSQDNLYHATVMPNRIWRKLFEAAGFEIVEHPVVASMPFHNVYPDEERFWCLNQWRRLDPFRDTHDAEPFYMLLKKRESLPTLEEFITLSNQILELHPKPDQTSLLRPETHLTFIVGHYQDFHHYRPYWDALERSSFTILLRSGPLRGIEARRFRAVLAYLKSHGYDYREVESAESHNWLEKPEKRHALIVATESTSIDFHLLNGSFVLAAKMAGYRTFQLQHGIWPYAEFKKRFAFTCENILSWSQETPNGFDPPNFDSVSPSKAMLDHTRFHITGCAKFDEYQQTARANIADILGDWAESFERTVLVATNLHWPQNHRGSEVIPALISLAKRRPEILFLCKLHPVHDPDGALLDTLPTNLRVLDEFTCLFANISTPQLVRASDAVISTPSTVVLEAALADVPFLMLDTENPTQYVGVQPVPIASMEAELDRLFDPERRLQAIKSQQPFLAHYFDRSTVGKGLKLALDCIEAELDRPAEPVDAKLFTASCYSAAFSRHYHPRGRAEAESLYVEVERLHGSVNEIRSDRANIQAALDGLTAHRDHVQTEYHKLRAEYHRLQAELQNELAQTRFRLDQAHNQLVPFRDLGPASIRVARAVRNISARHPKIASTLKAVARRSLRLIGK
jgi:hypothetical protein